MKLGDRVCLIDISAKFENGSSRVRNKFPRSNVRKIWAHSRGHMFCSILMKFGQNVWFDDFFDEYENGYIGSISWSIWQILEKLYVRQRGHICLFVLKDGQNVCLDDISNEFGNGSWWEKKLGHQVKSLENLVYAFEATFSVQYSRKLVTMLSWWYLGCVWKLIIFGQKLSH